MKIKIVIQHLLENIILNNAGAYTKKERKKKEENQFCHHFRKPGNLQSPKLLAKLTFQ